MNIKGILIFISAWLALFSFAFDDIPMTLSDSLLSQIKGSEQLRFFGGYKQGTDTSCGIAATASLLRYFFNIPIDEKNLIDKFFAAMETKKDYTVSMLDIKNVCESYGFSTKGVKIDLATLGKFDQYVPIVLHFMKPQAHFTLFIGMYGNYVLLDDPSIGVCFISADEFATKFSGFALFVYGMDSLKNSSLIADIRSTLTAKIKQLYDLSSSRITQ